MIELPIEDLEVLENIQFLNIFAKEQLVVIIAANEGLRESCGCFHWLCACTQENLLGLVVSVDVLI